MDALLTLAGRRRWRARGFGLTEMLLVVSVLALAALHEHARWQDGHTNLLLERSIMDLDYVDAATRHYRGQYGRWPETPAALASGLGLTLPPALNAFGAPYRFDRTDGLSVVSAWDAAGQADLLCAAVRYTACSETHEVSYALSSFSANAVAATLADFKGEGVNANVDMGGHYLNNVGSVNSDTFGIFDFRNANTDHTGLAVHSLDAKEIYADFVIVKFMNDPQSHHRGATKQGPWLPTSWEFYPPSRYSLREGYYER